MKICHITYDFLPAVVGSETQYYSVIKYLLRNSYNVDVRVIRSANVSKKDIDKAENTIN